MVATDVGVRLYDAMVNALGGYREFVTDSTGIRPALDRAVASGLSALVNVPLAETGRTSVHHNP